MKKTSKLMIISILSLIFILLILPYATAASLDEDVLVENDNDGEIEVLSDSELDEIDIEGDEPLYTDYYFDSSLDEDNGNGSYDNPYKELTDSRINNNSVIHLKQGTYNFLPWNSHTNITIIGEGASNTIINCTGDILLIDQYFTIKNLTFVNTPIFSQGLINGSNVVFKDCVSDVIVDKYNTTYGGAVYCCSHQYNAYFDNCSFINNSAEYGGAIYMAGGLLELYNCQFINNSAFNYGGAIVCDPYYESFIPSLRIKNTKFINSKSLNDAGGAIYIKKGNFEGEDITFINCSATFGSGIAVLNGTSTLTNIKGYNNSAKYNGGVIFGIYGNLSIFHSEFINNSAINGGALFLDNIYYGVIENNTFIDNYANLSAGAFYVLLSNNLTVLNNTYIGNSALDYDDYYKIDNLSLIFNSSNYTLYHVNLEDISFLPAYYSSVDEGYVTPVKDQQNGGNCWAFASLACLESNILKASGVELDLSEENMKNIASLYSTFGWQMNTNKGGYDDMAIGYLTSWLGPVLDCDDLYDGISTLSPILNSLTHIQNIIYLNRNGVNDLYSIKKAIMDYGAVYSAIYIAAHYDNISGKYVQYVGSSFSCDHAVCIVGWDDEFIVPGAPSKGAWIVKNSWGTEWGSDGYFYVSYYDKTCPKIGTDVAAFTFVLNDTMKYDKNYQYDLAKTDYFINDSSIVWYKNIFKSTDNEYLAAVSTYFEKNTTYEIYVYVNNILQLVKSGFSNPGYYTIDLGQYIPLNKGDTFTVVFKINVTGRSGVPISEKVSLNNYFYYENLSFISYDGENWTDLYGLKWEYPDHTYDSQVACIKAFTIYNKLNTTLELNVSYNGYNPVNITASILNQYGLPVQGGLVLFNLSGNEVYVNVTNGLANINYVFDKGFNIIYAYYINEGYYSSEDYRNVQLQKIDVEMTHTIITGIKSALLTVNTSLSINETLFVDLNGINYSYQLIEGRAIINLTTLNYGLNQIKIQLYDAKYVAEDIEDNFYVIVKKTKFVLDNLTAIYNSVNTYMIKLTDNDGEVLKDMEVFIKFNNQSFIRTTNENGEIPLNFNLAVGQYDLIVEFAGYDFYLDTYGSSKITILSSLNLSNLKFAYNSNLNIFYKDIDNNPLKNTRVQVILNGKTNTITTNDEGYGSLNIKLNPGTYTLKVINPNTTEVLTKSINVVSRISGGKDLSIYYGSTTPYKIRVCDDYGNYGTILQVKVMINGHTYNLKTDKNGYLSLTFNLAPKTYTITSQYNGFKTSNKITIKSTIVTKNIAVKQSKPIIYTVKLLNSSGKIIKNKYVKVTFKGKNYRIKTNSKGIATLKLKNKYKTGKYTIKTTYGKLSVTNKITIKR